LGWYKLGLDREGKASGEREDEGTGDWGGDTSQSHPTEKASTST